MPETTMKNDDGQFLIRKAHVNLGSDVLKGIILLYSSLSMAVSRGSFQK